MSVLRVAAGPRVKLVGRKRALSPPLVYSTDRSKAVIPVLVLLFGALWFILRGDLLYVLPCAILFLCFFSHFNIAITSLGEERANLSAFCMFDRFVLVWNCRFPLNVWEELRFVIVALPGLFSYLFLSIVLCYFIVFFSPFSIAITSLGKRASLSAFRTFIRFALFWFLSVSSSSSCPGLAAACDRGLPGLFSFIYIRGQSK